MAENRQFKFTQSVTSSGFSKALSLRVDDYFQSRGISKHANLEMVTKTILGFVATIASYTWLMTGHFTPLEVVGVYVVLGFAQLHMAFNIAHDANHGPMRGANGSTASSPAPSIWWESAPTCGG